MKRKIVLLITCVLIMAGVTQADVFYQSDFTGADLASAGLAASAGVRGTWMLDTDNDVAAHTSTLGNNRANLYTINSWQSDGGFTLDVTFMDTGLMSRYGFGLVDANWTVANATCAFTMGAAGAYGVGYSATMDQLIFNDGTGASTLSTGQGLNTPDTVETMTITVTSDSWSYSLNGAEPTTGSMTFDTSRAFRFVCFAQDVDEQYISNITLVLPVSNIASDPDPGNGENNVELDLSARIVSGELSWIAPEDYAPSGYDVYFGTTDPNLNGPAPYGLTLIGTAGQADPYAAPTAFLPLTNETTYYWVVDTYEPNELVTPTTYTLHQGAAWSFTAVSATPEFTTQPVSVLCGDKVGITEATFVASATSAASYQWYKDGGELSGEVSNTLTITGVTISDEGEYECEAINGAISTFSNIAVLEYAREKLHLDFEDDLEDEYGYATTWQGYLGMTYVSDGYLGQAISIDAVGDPNSAINVDPNAMPKAGLGISVSFWLKNEGEIRQAAVCRAENADSLAMLSILAPWPGNPETFVFDAGSGGDDVSRLRPDIDYAETQVWNHFVCTKDVVAGEMKIYRNGELYSEATGKTGPIDQTVSFLVGSDQLGRAVNGWLDDFRLYNYAISDEAVATLYYNATNVSTCINPPTLDIANGDTGLVQGDEGFGGDCIVNIYDFAALSKIWLECGLFPVCD